ncbi:uncharacterized protein A4U43_C10F9330 [Asparagus officinalis]|uniref:Uncharacterized protein n=1 Tax=Asparagus officinalis TaxID=4686 RepID=A0A5P1E1N5_ASPOF|nr:uncharacterized protein A4U43_C10F9330 [Asparagus officinalis]
MFSCSLSLSNFMIQQREKSWFASSLKSRFQYLGPAPRLPVVGKEPRKVNHLDQSAGPVDTFCLLVFDPDQVDYVNLKSNERLLFTFRPTGDGCQSWMSEKINP